MKISRNDPCPCNSGKKYKRCCLEKENQLRADEQVRREEASKRRQLGDELYFPSEDFIHLDLDGEIEYCSTYDIDGHGDILPELVKLYRENTSKEFYPIYDDEDDDFASEEKNQADIVDESGLAQISSFNEEDLIPSISKEEKKLIDEWWRQRKSIKDPVEEIAHIKTFLGAHPHLAANMYLQDEVIFELHDKFSQREDYHLFADFLIYYRENYPAAYILSCCSYDKYLITYFLLQQKSNEEIIPYFSFLIKYPVRFIDQFMDIVSVIILCGREDLLPSLYQNIYISLDRSDQFFDKNSVISPYIYYRWNPYVKQLANPTGDQSEIANSLYENHVRFISPLKNVKSHIGKKRFDRSLREHFGPLPQKEFPHPFNYIEMKRFYALISNNFAGYQVREFARPWLLSNTNASDIFYLLMYPLENNKIPNYPFKFNRELLDKFVSKKFRSFFSLKILEAFNFVFMICDFWAYLKAQKLISQEEFQQLHEATTSILDRLYKISSAHTRKYFHLLISEAKQKGMEGI